MLYLAVEVGIGGVLVVDGHPFVGAQGEGGEFGHMPFGTDGLACPCGASGCWDLEVDGRALARALGRRAPADPRAFAARVIAAANARRPCRVGGRRRGGRARSAAAPARSSTRSTRISSSTAASHPTFATLPAQPTTRPSTTR